MQVGEGEAMMRGFIKGTRLSPSMQSGVSLEDLELMLGRIARYCTQGLIRMLQDRAAVKFFISNEGHTMRVAKGNNPMKFIPDTNQAFEALFLVPRDGYLTGADGFENALNDVRRHKCAVIAAIQPALAEMLDGLSPEDIEKSVGSGMLFGGSRKAWGRIHQTLEVAGCAGRKRHA